ncbi:MAG TPA: ATP phosphoribosyltransferase regulatory subunit [Rhodocyclaceae bacterium]|nr:ATP phosphoribosyltransferase regulatory subunit [Rhodocyclaceae bacterium]
MSNRRWLLPESIEDVLPPEARQIETLRRAMLDEFLLHGYDYVIPPLLEYEESLKTSAAPDLELRTFKLVDQLSGRSMGVRADMTPQVARIDAHLLNRQGVTRLCYCGSVLHTLPAGVNATREPFQIGAEVYGHAGLEADIEAIRLLCELMTGVCNLHAPRLDLGHVGVFRALAKAAGLDAEAEQEFFVALQGKDAPTLRLLVAAAGIAEPTRSALLALPELYGDIRVLERAARLLPPLPEILAALEQLRRLADALQDAPMPLSFDLADLRGYHYHSGVVFAVYAQSGAVAVGLGGRYDDIGRAYGRARPATGFSIDLRNLARLLPKRPTIGAILAPWPEDDAVHAEVLRLRAAGERVVLALPGHEGSWREAGCDRALLPHDGAWIIKSLEEN